MGILRTLLALSVVLAHSGALFGFELVGGRVAVQAFYMISGFYMTLVLTEKYVGKNNNYFLFISNRLLRLWPVYWIVLICSIILTIIIFKDSNSEIQTVFDYFKNYGNGINFTTLTLIIIANITTVFQDWLMFLGVNLQSGSLYFTANFLETTPPLFKFIFVPQAWTIGVEITFYLIAPFLVRKKIKVIVILILSSLILRILLIGYGYNYDPWSYRFFPTELLFFLLGTVGYHIYKVQKSKKIADFVLYSIYFLVLAITFLYSFSSFEYKQVVFLMLFFSCIPFVFLLSKNWKIDRYIGELSYPIYICHLFVSAAISYFEIPTYGGRTFTLVFLTVGFSILLNEFIAKPIEYIRQKRVLKNK